MNESFLPIRSPTATNNIDATLLFTKMDVVDVIAWKPVVLGHFCFPSAILQFHGGWENEYSETLTHNNSGE